MTRERKSRAIPARTRTKCAVLAPRELELAVRGARAAGEPAKAARRVSFG